MPNKLLGHIGIQLLYWCRLAPCCHGPWFVHRKVWLQYIAVSRNLSPPLLAYWQDAQQSKARHLSEGYNRETQNVDTEKAYAWGIDPSYQIIEDSQSLFWHLTRSSSNWLWGRHFVHVGSLPLTSRRHHPRAMWTAPFQISGRFTNQKIGFSKGESCLALCKY